MNWQLLFKVLKWSVPGLLLLIVYNRFYKHEHLSVEAIAVAVRSLPIKVLSFLSLMTLLNWIIEAKKWQLAIQSTQKLSFLKALKAVLAGLSVSQLLPFRTGEFLGRLAYIQHPLKPQAALVSAMVSWTQLACTLLFGTVAFLFLRPVPIPHVLLWSILAILLVFVLGLKYASNIRALLDWPIMKAFKEAYQALSKPVLMKVFALSVLRYMTFVIPYAILVKWFGVGHYHSILWAIIAVSTVYLIQTLGPSFILTDIAIRVSVPALVFSGGMVANQSLDFLPGIIIYLFNVVLPMFIGAMVLLTLKLKA